MSHTKLSCVARSSIKYCITTSNAHRYFGARILGLIKINAWSLPKVLRQYWYKPSLFQHIYLQTNICLPISLIMIRNEGLCHHMIKFFKCKYTQRTTYIRCYYARDKCELVQPVHLSARLFCSIASHGCDIGLHEYYLLSVAQLFCLDDENNIMPS